MENIIFCAVDVLKFFRILKELYQKYNRLNLNELEMGLLTHFWSIL